MSFQNFIRAAQNRPGSFEQFLRGKGVAKSILTAEPDSGGAGIPGGLQKQIVDNLPEYSLALTFLNQVKASSGKKHEFARLKSLGGPVPPVGEKANSPRRSSKLVPAERELKIQRRKMRLSGYLVDSQREDEVDFEMVGMEIENQVRGHVNDLTDSMFFGALERESPGIATLAGRRINLHDIANGRGRKPTDNRFLNSALNRTERWGAKAGNQVIYCTSDMIDLITDNEKSIVRMQAESRSNIGEIEIPGGIRLTTFRGRPLVPTPNCGGEAAPAMGAITLSPGPGNGNLSDGTYYVALTGIGWGSKNDDEDEDMGESELSVVASITLSGGTNSQSIQINFAENKTFLRYKVWVAQSNVVTDLRVKDIVSGWVYDEDDEPTAPINQIALQSLAATDIVPAGMRDDLPPLQGEGGVPHESIIIHCIDGVRGMGNVAYSNRGGQYQEGLITAEPLKKSDDFIEYLIRTYWSLIDANTRTSAIIQGVCSL